MARYGLRAQDRPRFAVEGGIGGVNVTTTIEGRERIPIQVRLARDERDDIERLGDILVSTLHQATIHPARPARRHPPHRRPGEIASENGRCEVFVQANVQGRDLGGFVEGRPAAKSPGLNADPA
jgi:Cu(I)/Ag(I) efflux system membrane protein CusA/SilA